MAGSKQIRQEGDSHGVLAETQRNAAESQAVAGCCTVYAVVHDMWCT